MVNKKFQVWLPLLLSIVMVIGMFLGYQLKSEGSKDFFQSDKPTSLQEALQIIKMKYVDAVNIDSLQHLAIEQIMSDLDPHSVYLPPAELKQANEDLQGKYAGIGIEFTMYNDTVQVVYAIPGSPGDKAGVQPGDIVLKANDSTLSGKKLTTDDIRKIVRGQKDSKVNLLLLRNGNEQTITVTRGNIPVPSVDVSFMMNATTAYLKINKFSETTYEEFMYAMENLKKQGMQNLILDLRHNGGGLLEESVDVADEFLGGDKLIVYTEGANSKKREYKAKRPGILESGKVVVLVDELTASASEVLCGALQDWCRATIIGRRTFGKGLVMEQFPLRDGAAIRLTTARYYTPVGRFIQRSYDKGKKVYMDELWNRYSNGSLLAADSDKVVRGKAFLTVCKDTVYEGEGIIPNIFVPLDTTIYSSTLNKLFASSTFNKIAFTYYFNHKAAIDKSTSINDFLKTVDVAPLYQSLLNTGEAPKNITEHIANRIKLQLKAQIAKYHWGNAGYYQTLTQDDQYIEDAMKVIEK
ncbi:MAG: S41 family peptidase [Bacteroidetes bacterium]|nr:S41 family peptidase [Bacteroidota bacterium]